MVIMQKTKHTSNESFGKAAEEVPNNMRIMAQEVRMVKALACNDLNKRNKQIRKLRKWLILRANSSFVFDMEDFMRLWKGLYYNMWMSDKPLVQEELAENLGQLIDCFNNVHLSIMFFDAFMRTIYREWFGIDQWRMDKFLMLMRRMLRCVFRVLKRSGWEEENIQEFNDRVFKLLLEGNASTGLTMHFLDIYFEELAKVSDGGITADQVSTFVKPFIGFLVKQRDPKLISHCRTRVFHHLLYQSDLGREYVEKYNTWRDMGFPTKSIHELEEVETDSGVEEEENVNSPSKDDEGIQSEKHLDPRAGNIDVFMPELPLSAQFIIDELNLLLKKVDKTKCRKMLRRLLQAFESYQNGEFPLGVKTMPRFEGKSEKPLIKDKIKQLENLENEMFSTVRKLKQLNKRKRHKLLKSIDYTNLDESNFEDVIEKSIPKQHLKARKKRKSLQNEWIEEELDAVPPKKVLQSNKLQRKAANTIQEKLKLIHKNKIAPTSKSQEIIEDAHETEQTALEESAETVRTASVCKKAKKKQKITKEKTEAINVAKKTSTADVLTPTTVASEWDLPLCEGEIEYFTSSFKTPVKIISELNETVQGPFPKSKNVSTVDEVSTNKQISFSTPKTRTGIKKVKIQLKNNTEQKPSEYIKQIRCSPNLPYDANKKPGKGLLKPNSVPSPINPFYKKKIGLRLLNETL